MIREISPQELAIKLENQEPVYLVDVRQEWECALAILPGSHPIPLGELIQRVEEIQPKPGETVVVICHHGVRSLRGAAILEKNGISPVFSLAGGIDAWSICIDPTVPRY